MAQSTTNLGKIHVFPSETLYNQFKDIIADNDLALLKDDGAYIVAANLAQNGYVKFSNGLILQWGVYEGDQQSTQTIKLPISVNNTLFVTHTYNTLGHSCGWVPHITETTTTTIKTVNDVFNSTGGKCIHYWLLIGI